METLKLLTMRAMYNLAAIAAIVPAINVPGTTFRQRRQIILNTHLQHALDVDNMTLAEDLKKLGAHPPRNYPNAP